MHKPICNGIVICRLSIFVAEHQVVATDYASFIGLRIIGGQEILVVFESLCLLPMCFCDHSVR